MTMRLDYKRDPRDSNLYGDDGKRIRGIQNLAWQVTAGKGSTVEATGQDIDAIFGEAIPAHILLNRPSGPLEVVSDGTAAGTSVRIADTLVGGIAAVELKVDVRNRRASELVLRFHAFDLMEPGPDGEPVF